MIETQTRISYMHVFAKISIKIVYKTLQYTYGIRYFSKHAFQYDLHKLYFCIISMQKVAFYVQYHMK